MATHDMPILGPMTAPDSSGSVFFEPLEVAMTLGTATFGTLLGLTIQAPSGADVGVYGSFVVPQNYVGTPLCVIRGTLAEAANTLAFGLKSIQVAHAETVEIAFDTEDVAENSTWTGLAAEEMYEEIITMTPATAYVAGDVIFFYLFRDDDQGDQTGEFHLSELLFRYNDA